MMLRDKVVVVAGVGPGLGRSIALAAAREGADVVLAARTAERLDEVAKEVDGLGRRALSVPTDLADAAAQERLAGAARNSFGRVLSTTRWRCRRSRAWRPCRWRRSARASTATWSPRCG
jgi:NAD(P)-dependent dehydrogenase (short-subunit alcohol dehydrogenase family)